MEFLVPCVACTVPTRDRASVDGLHMIPLCAGCLPPVLERQLDPGDDVLDAINQLFFPGEATDPDRLYHRIVEYMNTVDRMRRTLAALIEDR